MRLTQRIVNTARYEGTGNMRKVYWDDKLAGFGLRVHPSGRKSFVLSYRVAGRKRLMTIGASGPLTLKEARMRAKQHLVDIIDGKDPLETKRARRNGSGAVQVTDRERQLIGEAADDIVAALTRDHKHAEPVWTEKQREFARGGLEVRLVTLLTTIRRRDTSCP